MKNAKTLRLMNENMSNVYLLDWLNVALFPLFRQIPLNRCRVLAKSAPSHKFSLQSPFPRLALYDPIK
jgi:hypothetical protein